MTTRQPRVPGRAAVGPGSGDGPGGTEAPSPRKMRKVALASFMGTVIEFYDFGIYATASALVFADVFFPAFGDSSASIVTFATLGVAFVARPVGSLLFGHFGDRLGRKRTLIATMMLMGVATVAIGVLPTAASIGVVAPTILVLLRVAQGLAAGGEWAGAALFTSEHSPRSRRGFWAMFTNLGGAVANILALGTFLVVALFMSDETFTAWGWRIPFVLSLLLVAVGLYIRLRIEETPVFSGQARSGGLPVKDAFTHQSREILLGAGSLVMAFSLGYIGISYLISYGTSALGMSRPEVLAAGMFGNLVNGLAIISGGILSDRFGRRSVLLVANAVAIPWALVLFPLLDTRSPLAFWVGMSVTFVIAGHGFGVAGAFLSELFHTRYRYTAAGFAYSLAGVVGAAVPPLVAASMITTWGGFAFGVFLAGYCVISLLCVLRLSETRSRELTDIDAPGVRT